MVGAVIFGVFIVETFAVGFLLSQAKELREQNELLRNTNVTERKEAPQKKLLQRFF